MANKRDKDLLDELNCADACEAITAFCSLVDKMVHDIQQLELECISARYLLSQHMGKSEGELLRLDILENLGHRYNDDPAYELYRALVYDGGDPMNFCEYLTKVQEACNGKKPCWH